MNFTWINWVNVLAVACLILINVVAYRKGISEDFSSKHSIVNVLEQIGRYGCMALMILPVFTRDGEFSFASVTETAAWISLTVVLLVVYGCLWARKARGGASVLYALAAVPAVLFLLNGILLRHPALVALSLVFGIFHLIIVKENIRDRLQDVEAG